MRGRAGFTLLETIVALTLGAIVVTVASTALGAASDARTAVERDRTSVESESRLRAMLVDMLRHPPRAESVDEPLLRLERDGRGGVALTFLTQGVVQPFGTGAVWRVRLVADTLGVSMRASQLATDGSERGTPLLVTLPHLVGQHVAALDVVSGMSSGWRLDWPLAATRPAAVRIEWQSAGDGPAMSPLVIALDPLRGVDAPSAERLP